MLLHKVEKFLRQHDMPVTKFGRLAAHDPRFVLDMRLGRIPRPATEARTLKWMAEFEANNPLAPLTQANTICAADTAALPVYARPFETKGFSYAA
ncbi:MAG: hypothetical protein AAFY07_08095 [Pseudomonadota bacterium]